MKGPSPPTRGMVLDLDRVRIDAKRGFCRCGNTVLRNVLAEDVYSSLILNRIVIYEKRHCSCSRMNGRILVSVAY